MRRYKGFTLVELLVVIALIALLMTVMVPVILKFMSGRGLSMAGNNIGGFIAFGRTEAMNTRQSHVIVMYPEQEDISAPGSTLRLTAGPGMVLFRVNPNPTGDDQVVNFVRELNFSAQIGGDVRFADSWLKAATKHPMPELPHDANVKFRDKVKVVIRTDGRMMIPDDKPGYVLDLPPTKDLDTDIILTDGPNYLFIDLNPATGNVRRSPVLNSNDIGGTTR